jgi:hypothetical protein
MGLVERGAVNASIEIVGVIARTLGLSLTDLMAEVELDGQVVAGGRPRSGL